MLAWEKRSLSRPHEPQLRWLGDHTLGALGKELLWRPTPLFFFCFCFHTFICTSWCFSFFLSTNFFLLYKWRPQTYLHKTALLTFCRKLFYFQKVLLLHVFVCLENVLSAFWPFIIVVWCWLPEKKQRLFSPFFFIIPPFILQFCCILHLSSICLSFDALQYHDRQLIEACSVLSMERLHPTRSLSTIICELSRHAILSCLLQVREHARDPVESPEKPLLLLPLSEDSSIDIKLAMLLPRAVSLVTTKTHLPVSSWHLWIVLSQIKIERSFAYKVAPLIIAWTS